MKFAKTLVTLLLVLSFFFARAQNNIPTLRASSISIYDTETLGRLFYAYTTIHMPEASITGLITTKSAFTFRLTLPGDLDFSIQLQPAAIISSDYQLELLTENGKVHRKSNPDHFYKGKLSGNDSSSVSATITDHYLSFNIHDGKEEYYIEPLSKYLAKGKKGEYIVYKTSDLKQQTMLHCLQLDGQTEKNNNITASTRMSADTCLTIPIVLMADYMMYQLYEKDISALETALIENINQMQSYYTGFNLIGSVAGDVGNSNLNFKVVKVVVATCNTCDVISNSTETNRTSRQLYDYLRTHPQYDGYSMINFWSPRNLYSADLTIGGIAGGGYYPYINAQFDCPFFAYSMLQFNRQNPAFMKLLMAHETGHNLGCAHDDEVKSSVKGFVMQNSAPLSASRFSRLTDFGGTNYSSNLRIKQVVQQRLACIKGCSTAGCEEVKEIAIRYPATSDSVYIDWKENGKVWVRLKEEKSNTYLTVWEKEMSGNSLAIGELKTCQNYELEVSRLCAGGNGKLSTLRFRTSGILLHKLDILPHTALYDLRLRLYKGSRISNTTKLLIDNVERKFYWNERKGELTVFDLTSDNRIHKLEVKDTLSGIPCHYLNRYTAPDGRKNTTVLLKEDFNDCVLPANWKDSVTRQITWNFNYFRWHVSKNPLPNSLYQMGSFDSTCFLFYMPYSQTNGCCGGRALISPVINTLGYKDLTLSFDYVLKTYMAMGSAKTYFKVEVFDGSKWNLLMEKTNDQPQPRNPYFNNVWDSIPDRVQFPIDAYKNKAMQIRFSFDDSYSINSGNHFYLGMDNIRIDGIRETENISIFTIAPNPVRDYIRIQFNKPYSGDLQYELHDLAGRMIESGKVSNYRINTHPVGAGIYLLKLYNNNIQIGDVSKLLITK